MGKNQLNSGPLRTTIRYLSTSVIVFLSGCAVETATRQDVSTAVERWQRRRAVLVVDAPPVLLNKTASSDSDFNAYAGEAAPEQPKEQAPDTIGAYTVEALQHNRAVMAAIAEVRAKLERIAQVTALDDPILRMIVRPEPIQTAAGDIVFTLGINQKIPLPAKLDRKGRMAAAEARMAIARLNGVRLRVISDVTRAYYRAYVTDRSIELTAANHILLEDLERVVDSQYRVGKVEQQDLLRIQIELSDLANEESGYRHQRIAAAAAMNELLDRPPGTDLPETKPMMPAEITTRVEDLIALAAEHNPELIALIHRADRDREGIELANLGYVPDMTVGFEWNHVDGRRPFIPPVNPQTGRRPLFNNASAQGDDNWAITAAFNLPVWVKRIEAAKREARHILEGTRHLQGAAYNLVAFRIYDAWARVQTQQDTVKLLDSTLIPQARQTYEVSLSSYQGGKTDFLDVIETWRQLLGFQLMLHREIAGLETTFSELEREVGLELLRSNYEQETTDSQEVQP